MTDWIKHDGGDCPVPPDTVVDVQLRSGAKYGHCKAGHWIWSAIYDMKNGGIIAYRIIEKEKPITTLQKIEEARKALAALEEQLRIEQEPAKPKGNAHPMVFRPEEAQRFYYLGMLDCGFTPFHSVNKQDGLTMAFRTEKAASAAAEWLNLMMEMMLQEGAGVAVDGIKQWHIGSSGEIDNWNRSAYKIEHPFVSWFPTKELAEAARDACGGNQRFIDAYAT